MKISVLGCGWLGFPLSRHLIEKDYQVKGSSTSKKRLPELKQHGIDPFLIQVREKIECQNCDDFWDCDLLFLNIPPGRSRGDVLTRHPLEVRAIADIVKEKNIPWVIFASSTSVYSKFGGVKSEEDIDEKDTASDSGRALLQCENLLMNSAEFDTTIIRFGGLYGYDRHPGRNLAGKTDLADAGKPVNLIHQDDCIQIISSIIELNIRNETLNAVSDEHPDRQSFYQAMAAQFDLPKPEFRKDEKSNYRIVSNSRLKKRLNYQFLYPDPNDPAP